MKLSRRLLVPIMLVSFFAMAASSYVYYSITENEIDNIYRGDILTTIAGLKTEMEISGSLNDAIMERANDTDIALVRTIAMWLEKEPETYLSNEGLESLTELMHVGEIHVTDADGMIVYSSDGRYLGRDATEQQGEEDLLAYIGDYEFTGAQEPRVSSGGYWVQFHVVSRRDAPGLVIVGIQYSISSLIQSTFTDGINAELAQVGETGHVAILHDGVYAAHTDETMLGIDVNGVDWYEAIYGAEMGVDWFTIDGEEYLVGYNTTGDDIVVLALLPHTEYYASLRTIQFFSIALIAVFSLLMISVLYYSLRMSVINPLAIISSAVNKVSRGDLSVNIQGNFTGEMETLRQDVNRTIGRLKMRQDNVFRSYPGIIMSCDADGICTLADGDGMERIGLKQTSYIGNNVEEVLRKNGAGEVADMLARTVEEMKAQRLNMEWNGRYLSLTSSTMYDEEGTFLGLVGVCNDVTDLHQLQQQLMAATEEAERASRAKTEFLSRMSHEIRTPMNAIIGMTTIGQKSQGDSAKIQYCLDKIQIASDQLLHLINDILDMSKIEANKFELSVTEFDIEKTLQNVCNVIEVNAAEKRQDFVVDFPDLMERNVVGDELRISQVLINLLNNAVKFTPEEGQVTLRVRRKVVDEKLLSMSFDIIDSGIGVSQEQQKRLFSSFEQADGSITRRYGGTGLGLVISRSIVNMMGGEIEIESRLGFGSRFSFTINLQRGNEKGGRDWVKKLPVGDWRALVIDDSREVCLYFEEILKNYHLGCDTATSGAKGIKMVQAALDKNEPYNLIFVDWMMPGMSGIEVARHIKNMVPVDTIVVLISVADWSDIEREARSIGVDKFLAKPVLPTVLFKSIVDWLNASEAEKEKPEETQDAIFTGKTMLLAEDIEINREIVIGMLDGTGITIEEASDGEMAVAMYHAHPSRYDVVLMDIQMPGKDGYEATRAIRTSNRPTASTLPIIAMTANAFSTDVEKCIAAGMSDHIAKPVDINDLYKKLRAVFGM